MKKLIILITLLSFVNACNNKIKEIKIKSNQSLKETDPINGNTYIYYFKNEKNLFKKEIILFKLDSIELYINEKKYTLNLTDKNICSDFIEGNVYANEDYNFDGIADILLFPHIENYSVYGKDYRGNYFLYDKKNLAFKEQLQLDSINNLEVDKKNQRLISKNSLKNITYYHWINEKLIIQRNKK